MIHKMRLVNFAFNAIKNGEKDIEVRLNDEKRQLIKIGDIIEFEHLDTKEIIRVMVVNLHKYNNFQELFNAFDHKRLGLKDSDDASIMDKFYTKEEQNRYGALGIEIKLISDKKNNLDIENKMQFEKEITVEINTTIDNLRDILKKNKFVLKQEYDVNDIYMVKNDTNLHDNGLNVLNNCVLIRNIITDKKDIKCFTYKYKDYDKEGNITKNGKINCYISSIDEAKNLLDVLGYKELLKIEDHIMVYANDVDEFCIQMVNNKHIYIEIEENCEFINKKYNDIDDMISSFNKYNIPIKRNDYFAKKAFIEFNEIYNNK